MRNWIGASLFAVVLASCAGAMPVSQAQSGAPPSQAQSLQDRRPIIQAELAEGCLMPNPPRFSGQFGVVAAELEARYRENDDAFVARDSDRVMLLRHPEFHTITPDGTRSTREQMYERTRQFIDRIEQFTCVSESITALTMESDDTALAVMDQRTVRSQRLPDGALHDVRTWVVQRETWKKVDGVWLMWRVDEIQPGLTILDGTSINPGA